MALMTRENFGELMTPVHKKIFFDSYGEVPMKYKSIFKTGIGGNKWLFIANGVASVLMLIVLLIPGLQQLFGIIMLPIDKLVECIILIFIPVIIVEIMKLLKINTSKDE